MVAPPMGPPPMGPPAGPPGMGPPPPPGGPPMPGGMPGMPPMPPMPPPDEPPVPTSRELRQARRLRDYELPEVDKPPKPTKEKILALKEQRVEYWQGRNEEIEADLGIYFMDGAIEVKTTGKGGEEIIRRITGRAMVDKVSNMVDRQADRIQCTPRSQAQEYVEAAQDCEDWLVDMRREMQMRAAMRMEQSTGRTEGWNAAACGWIASRTCLAPGKPTPIRSELYDPRHCYPGPADPDEVGQITDMLYTETTDKATFVAANPQWRERDALKRLKDDAEVEVVWYEDRFYKVVLVNGDRLTRGEEEEHGYQFCPWVMIPVNGTPLWDKQRRRHHGAGILRALRPMLKYEDRFYSQLATAVAQDANPARMTTYNSSLGGAPKEVDLRPGAQNSFDVYKGEGFQPYVPALRGDLLAPQRDMIDEDISRGGVDSMLLGGNRVPPNSGFQFDVMRTNAEDVLQPVTRGIIMHRQWVNRLMLNLILVAEREGLLDQQEVGEVGEEPTQGVRYRRPNRAPGARSAYTMARGGRAGSAEVYAVLTPDSVHKHGVGNDVMLSNITPQAKAQMVQVMALAIGQKILSRRTAWEQLGFVADPELENMRIVYESFMFEDPEMLKAYWGPMAVAYFSPDAAAWMEERDEAIKEQQAEQERRQMEMMLGLGGPAGALPPPGFNPEGGPMPPGPGGPPLPGMGLDSTVLPPQEQAITGMPGAGDAQSVEALLAMLAQGGGPPIGD